MMPTRSPIRRLILLVAIAHAVGLAKIQGQVTAGDSVGVPPSVSPQAEPGASAVRPGDVLEIRVWPDASLSGEFAVENTGFVYLPVIGRVQVSGLTLEELRTALRDALGQAMKDPVVTITPKFRVTLMGGVSAPGLYSVDPTVTFWDLVTLAGGFGERAKRDEVQLFRDNGVYRFDAAEAMETGNLAVAPALQSGDRIYVPSGSGVSFGQVTSILQLTVATLTLIRLFSSQ